MPRSKDTMKAAFRKFFKTGDKKDKVGDVNNGVEQEGTSKKIATGSPARRLRWWELFLFSLFYSAF